MRSLAECLEVGYVINGSIRLQNSYYQHCKDQKVPYIKINHRGRNHASLTIDLFPTPWDFTHEAQGKLKALLLDAGRRAGGRKAWCVTAGEDAASVTRCRADEVVGLAKTLHDFACDPQNLESHREKWLFHRGKVG